MNRVRTNSKYEYRPVPLDRIDPPQGVKDGILSPGMIVKVVRLPGCPPANTMSHCHIVVDVPDVIGRKSQFAGLVATNSLRKPGTTQ